MRLNQFLATASGLSRRSADAAINDSRVIVNGIQAIIGQNISSVDTVLLDGKKLKLPDAFLYIALNKPIGYITSRAQQGKSPTIYDLLPTKYANLQPVGRLDKDSHGLLLMSNDGAFIYRLTHPSNNKIKVYALKLAHELTAKDAARLHDGVKLEDGLSKIRVQSRHGRDVVVEIGEGRNRQIRRTFGAINNGTMDLKRIAVGEYLLGDIPTGQWRELKAPAAVKEIK